MSGGVSERAQITGGRQQVDDGGTSVGAVVSGRGRQEVSGTTRQTVVKSGGIIDIIDNGVAEQTLLDGGEMNVDFGAVSRNTTISSGTQSVYGTDTDSTINGGVQQIESGGVASGATVRNGGVQSVFSGGEAENTVVERNGWLFLFAGGTLSGKTSVTEGVVTFVGSNSIPDMEMRNARCRLSPTAMTSVLCSLTICPAREPSASAAVCRKGFRTEFWYTRATEISAW